jgi:RES domain-containing protein
MTPLHPLLGGGNEIVAWRLDLSIHASTWDSGKGAFLAGGRWNTKGKSVVYCSLDPSTAILEVATHKGFKALDTVPHTLTSLAIIPPASRKDIHAVFPADLPNPTWLSPGNPSAGQQQYGDQLLKQYPFILIPSTVSSYSWNVLFDTIRAKGLYKLLSQERFALDTRLHPPS